MLNLAEQFLRRSNLPAKADVDAAVHIAAATVHGMDYLLTWNCKHIANAQIQSKLAEISLDLGYELPISGREIVNLSHKPGLTTRWIRWVKDSGEDAKETSRRTTSPL